MRRQQSVSSTLSLGKERIRYIFTLEGERKVYDLEFDPATMNLLSKPKAKAFAWVKLGFAQCGHCPLDEAAHPECPVARNIAEVVEAFKDTCSTMSVGVEVVTRARTYIKDTTLHLGLFGMMGLIMATSGCPHMDFLRPLARFHLPFATSLETTMRSLSMFLLREYVEMKKQGEQRSIDLKKLDEHYADVKKVNAGIIRRIRAISRGDADVNALVSLDGFASLLSNEIANDMHEIASLFD